MSKNKLANLLIQMMKKGTSCASLFFISSSLGFAYNQDLRLTEYQFESKGHLKGQCFEIDRKTKGQDYKVAKPELFCEKLFEKKATLLLPNKNGVGGECYQVDTETKGYQFAQRKPYSFCRPEKTSFEWVKNRCYEKGLRDDGLVYFQNVRSESCLSEIETQKVWLADQSGLSGSCFIIDRETQGKTVREITTAKDCKPEATVNMWLKDQHNPLQGRCYTLDAKNGPQGYVVTTQDSDCLVDEKSSYSWLQKTEFEGECFEIKQTNTGEKVSKKVQAIHCKPQNVDYVFNRTSQFNGYCLERDRQTQGQAFQQKVRVQLCRPPEVLKIWVEVPGDLRSGECMQVDKETQGMKYLELRPRNECIVLTGQYHFELNVEKLEGQCFEVTTLGSEIKRKRVAIQNCQPKAVKTAWNGDKNTLEGHCYEIDEVHGAHGFLKRVAPRHCKPFYLEDVEYIFHRTPGTSAGRCFEVDKKTGGLLYAVSTADEKCRKQLRLPDL